MIFPIETWPRSIGNWVMEKQLPWPPSQLAAEVMQEGITLIARESVYSKDKQSPSEGDAWLILLNGKPQSQREVRKIPFRMRMSNMIFTIIIFEFVAERLLHISSKYQV